MIWYIERIPAAGGASETRTLDAWGIDSATITGACWGLGGADIVLPSATAGTTAPAWADGDHLVVWAGDPAAGGTRRAHLWVLMPGTHADPQAESHQYRLVDPWYWLEQTQFFYPLTISDITTDPETGAATGCTWHMRHGTTVVWTSWAAQSSGTTLGQIHRALYCAVDNGAPIAIGAIDLPGLAPVADQQTLTCADVIARAARYSPRASQWWDMSGATPVFRAASLASRPTLSLALGPDSQTWDIGPRHDLRIDVVRIGYQYPSGDGTAVWYDIAGDDELLDGPHTLRSLVDCPDSATASNAASHYGIAAQLYTALHSTPYTGTLAWWGDAAGALAVHPGHALNLTGGMTAWATMAAPIASVTLTITSAAEDSLSITLGLPATLGANDLFELYNLGSNLGNGAVATTGGTEEPTSPGDPTPGTYDDLNGSTGGGTPEGIIAVQARGGSWELVGYTAYKGLDPTRRWRTRTFGGTVTGYISADGGISSTLRGVVSQSGSYTLSDTGSVSGAAAYTTISGSIVTPPNQVIDPTDPYGLCSSAENDGASVMVTAGTATTWASTGTGAWGTSDGVRYYRYTGAWTVALSDEDTIDDAVSRVLATAEWGSATTAIRTIPTTGITGLYREARYRTEHTEDVGQQIWIEGQYLGDGTWQPGYWKTVLVAGTYPTLYGLSPWQRYQVTVTLESRPVDSAGAPTGDGSWSAAGTRQHYFVADITGEGGIDWQVVEPTAGYETRIASALVEAA